jgi:excisionase family DNA binding protein
MNIESGGTLMTQAEIDRLTNEMMREWFPAPDERKAAAVKALRGQFEAAARPVVGPLLMGMGDAGKYLGVSRSTLWRIIQAGKLEKVELFSGSFRVRREDLVALAAGECGTGEQTSRRGRPRGGGGKSGVGYQESVESGAVLAAKQCKGTQGSGRTEDPRFQQLKALADEGDENAAADLFREFGFEHGAALRQAQGDHDADAAGQRGAE